VLYTPRFLFFSCFNNSKSAANDVGHRSILTFGDAIKQSSDFVTNFNINPFGHDFFSSAVGETEGAMPERCVKKDARL
jgi:hypothetical protein